MVKRIITGALLACVLIPAIIFGGVFYLILAMFFAYVGTYELMNMFNKKDENLNIIKYIVPVLSAIFVLCLYFVLKNSPYAIYYYNGNLLLKSISNYSSKFFRLVSLTISEYLLSIIGILIFNVFKKNTNAHTILSSIVALTYGGVLLGAAFCVEYLPVINVYEDKAVWGGQLFGYLYSIVAITDMAAYFVGSKLGKKKLCPDISPKKSVEGAIGGLVFGSLFGTLFAYLFGVMPITSIASGTEKFLIVILFFILSLVISVVVQIGDLVASKLKRTYEIKDYGFIFPGHGGVMDRFDSLILSGSLLFALYSLLIVIL